MTLAVTAVIGIFTLMLTSYKAIAQGARMGRESYEKVKCVERRTDSIERKVTDLDYNQRAVNIRLDNDVKWIKETLSEIKQDIKDKR